MLLSDNTTLYYEVHVGSDAVKAQLKERKIKNICLYVYKFQDRCLTHIIQYNGKNMLQCFSATQLGNYAIIVKYNSQYTV